MLPGKITRRFQIDQTVLVIVIAGLLLLASRPASAALIPDGADDNAYIAYGAQMAGKVLWMQATTMTGGIESVSATFLDPWDVLTAAHCVEGASGFVSASSIEIGTGTNYMTNPGTVVHASGYVIYPQYDLSFDEPDLAIIHLASPILEPNAVISSAFVGEVLTGAGFGLHGTPDGGILPADGYSRAWNAPVVPGNTSNVSDEYYISTDFAATDRVSLNGKGYSGDSGGPLFDADGGLVGINVAEYGGTEQVGGTESVILSEPAVSAWLTANTTVPEPSGVLVAMMSCSVLFARRRQCRL